ncbi:glycosyltransferase family 4 protein [Oxynema sp. CENA135]|uniref:glycosyltransferase family 4 protein n=1 Tax=Oxynema sp. CENA135 TaxID=984206 RepID=UPI00190D11B1|nr:glycosyltransferase family 4 protein [Oxynema sp. CENA135]MBK4730569.1 glycosyltransferase family 4 protein [Oxynema sp. CENA135]
MDSSSAIAPTRLHVTMLGPTLRQKGGVAAVEEAIVRHAPPELKIDHIVTHEEGSIARRLQVFATGLKALTAQLGRGETDLVHIHFAERGSVFRKAIALSVVRRFGKPAILHAHGSEFHTFYQNLAPVWREAIARIFRQSSYLIVLSESWKTFYVEQLNLDPDQVIPIPNPVEIPPEVPDRRAQTTVNFLFLGRIGQRKGAFDAIEAFAALPPDRRDRAALTMAGDGEIERARDRVSQLNLGDRITFPGWVDPVRRAQLLAEASVFVLPSYNEGLPMALLESMSWQLPAIATPVGGIAEVLTPNETGWLVTPGAIAELSAAMQQAIDNEPLRIRLGINARHRVQPLDVKTYCDRLHHLYRSALESPSK